MAEVFAHGDLRLGSSLVYNKSLTDFPIVPKPYQLVFKAGRPYAYCEVQSGFWSWMPMAELPKTYIHMQGVASQTWTVNHNLNTVHVGIFVYDNNHDLQLANFTSVDANQINVELTESIEGTCLVVGFDAFGATSLIGSQLKVGSITLTESNGNLAVNGVEISSQIWDDLSAMNGEGVASLNGDINTDFSVNNLTVGSSIVLPNGGVVTYNSTTGNVEINGSPLMTQSQVQAMIDASLSTINGGTA